MLISNPLKKLQKNAPEKCSSQSNFMFISKLAKLTFFGHIFVDIFFWVHFFASFSMESKSACNSAFFDTSVDFLKQIFKNLDFADFFSLKT